VDAAWAGGFLDYQDGAMSTYRSGRIFEPGPDQPERHPAHASSKVILVVEDDESVRRPVSRHLARHGYKVTQACNIAEAEGHLRQSTPALIILDIRLPDGNGIEFLKRRREAGGREPIIVISGISEEADQLAAFDAGANDYVVKPLSIPVLLGHVRAWIETAIAGDPPILVDADGHALRKDTIVVALTPSEGRVLLALVQACPERGTRADLLATWTDPKPMSRTLDYYVHRLRGKLGVLGEKDGVRTERGGYSLRPGVCAIAPVM
jgi:DNA-binding response OmpR family regulator